MNAEKIKDMLVSGHKPREVAEAMGVTVETFKKFCQYNKIEVGKIGAGTWERSVNFKATDEDLKRHGTSITEQREKIDYDKMLREEKVKALHKRGFSQKQIQKELNMSHHAVRKILHNSGVEKKKVGGRKKFQPDTVFKQKYGSFKPDVEEVRRLYVEEEMTREMLAFHYKVSRSSIDSFLRNNKITLPKE
ncbi:hypothetical protein, partial [Staphylococcus aureus]|uniref:hypothetical protein n=1 Tax=Staphylococcus aureus TaxID=1280 RepID=UPI0020C0F8AB